MLNIVMSSQSKIGIKIKFDNNKTIINFKLVNWLFKLFNGSWQNILIIKIMIAGVVISLKNLEIDVEDDTHNYREEIYVCLFGLHCMFQFVHIINSLKIFINFNIKNARVIYFSVLLQH